MSSVYLDRKYINLISSRLERFKWKDEKLANCRCVLCGDSGRNKNKARGYFYLNKNHTGFSYKCHNCGAGCSFRDYLKSLDPSLYSEYSMEDFEDKKSVSLWSAPTEKKAVNTKPYESNVATVEIARQYLLFRKIPRKYWNDLYYAHDFKIFMDAYFPGHGKELKSDPRLIIPFFDEQKKIIAITGRSLVLQDHTKYLTIKFSDRKAYYGLDRFNFRMEGFVVEGPIDSMFLDNCMAVGNSSLYEVEGLVDKEKITLIYDNQRMNKEIVASMRKSVEKNFRLFFWPKLLNQKDINELVLSGYTTSEVHDLISKNTANGLDALLKLTEWSKV